MKESDKIRQYIKEHPDSIIEEVAEMFCKQSNNIRTYAKEVGVKLNTRKQVDGRDWIQPHQEEANTRHLNKLMEDPRVIQFIKENSFVLDAI